MVKYLIIGNGYLGNKFKDYLENSFLVEGKIKSIGEALSQIEAHNPEIVINCGGVTGKPNVDWCEDHKPQTIEGNILLPAYIALACNQLGIKMVHLGSGCIYESSGDSEPFSEEDAPNFKGSHYSRTKAIAENILSELEVLQVRLRMPLDDFPSNRNLLTKIMKYPKVISVPNSITYIPDLLRITKELIDKNAVGIYNVVNKGHVKHEQILQLYEKMSGNKLNYEIISLDELHSFTKAKRSNTVLSTDKLESMGINVPTIEDALERCVSAYVENEKKGVML